MEQKTSNIAQLFGRVVMPAPFCDKCKKETDNCCKVDILGIGKVCLLEKDDLYSRYEALQEESAKMSEEMNTLRKKLSSATEHCENLSRSNSDKDSTIKELTEQRKELTEQLKSKHNTNVSLSEQLNICRDEVNRLKKRGIIARLFNR